MQSHTRARYATPIALRPYLAAGLRYEQAGLSDEAIAEYDLAFSASVTPIERAQVHIRLARVQRTMSNWDAAICEARTAAHLADDARDDDIAAEAMNVEVGVHQLRGDFAEGERLAHAALTRALKPRTRGMLLQNLGVIAAQRCDHRGAERLFAESVEAFTEARYELGIALALNNASAAARDAGEFDRALELAILATEVAERIDALDIVMLARQNQAHALLEHGSLERAEVMLGEVIGHYAATGNLLRRAECLEIMGRINEWKPGYLDSAICCYRLTAELASKVGDRLLFERAEHRLAVLT